MREGYVHAGLGAALKPQGASDTQKLGHDKSDCVRGEVRVQGKGVGRSVMAGQSGRFPKVAPR